MRSTVHDGQRNRLTTTRRFSEHAGEPDEREEQHWRKRKDPVLLIEQHSQTARRHQRPTGVRQVPHRLERGRQTQSEVGCALSTNGALKSH